MNFSALLRTPFPRPQLSMKNLFWLTLIGLCCSLFIILYKPFGIQNTQNQWYYNLVVVSMGILFTFSILLVEWGFPYWFPKPFQKWTFGKAVLWYSSMTLFTGAVIFLYKSWWCDFQSFTLLEYCFVTGRVLTITTVVSFFIFGIYQFINQKKIALVVSKEEYYITSKSGKSLQLSLNNILYVESNDNYVNIHLELEGIRKKMLFRSSLKNVESQIATSFSPIHRCHRGYLINVACFEIQKETNRSMKIGLKNYSDIIPVSKQYINSMKQLLPIRH